MYGKGLNKKIFFIKTMVNNTILTTGITSIIIQIIAGVISLQGLFHKLPKEDYILKETLLMELIVQLIEGIFYIYIIYRLTKKDFSTHIRYYDWFITTPIMIISTIMFLGCLTITNKDSNADSFLPEKNEDTFTSGIKEGHKPPKESKLSSILY